MPLVEPGPSESFNLFTPTNTAVPPTPSLGETMGAAFRLENDVLNLIEYTSRPQFTPREGFDLKEKLRTNNLWDRRERFIGVRSDEEFDYIAAKAAKEDADRATLANAGWVGLGAAMLAGILSPTTLLPLTTGARGIGALRQGATWGLIAGGAQEWALQASQVSRSAEESAFSIATTTVLGGILGGAAGFLTREELARIADDMYDGSRQPSISYTYGTSGGAKAVAEASAGGLKPLPWGTQWLSQIGPVTRGVDQDFSPVGQFMTAQFGTAGLRLSGNAFGIPSAAGGTIENAVRLWDKNLADAVSKLDELYQTHIFEGGPVRLAGNLRADMQGLLQTSKLSRREFNEEVGRAMFVGDQSTTPEAAAAAAHIRKVLYDPLFKEAEALGVVKPGDLGGDASYLNRLYNEDVIQARMGDFIDTLQEHIETKLTTEFKDQLSNLVERETRDQLRAEDLQRAPDEVAALREQFEKQLSDLEAGRTEDLAEAEDQLATLRRQARQLRKEKTPKADLERRELLRQARELESGLGEEFAKLKENRAAINRRLKNLNRNVYVVGERYAKKLEKVERIEELQLRSLDRIIRSAERVAAQLDKVSPERLATQAGKLKDQFENVARLYDEGEERLVALANDPMEQDINRLINLQEVQEGRAARMNALADRLEDVEALDDDGLRALIGEALEETKRAVNDLNSRRAVRRARLQEQAVKLDPALVRQDVETISAKISERRGNFVEAQRTRGADDVDMLGGVANFSRHSRELAQQIADRILGTNSRLQGMHLLLAERGPELARMLDLPSTFVSKNGVQFSDFLVTDIEKAMRTYLRTLSADVEVARKFGTADAREWFQRLSEEYYAQVDALKTATTKEGKPLSPQEIEKRTKKLSENYHGLRNDLEALLERTRGIRGIPKDPRSLSARAGRTLMNLNVLRLMGSVAISSVPDLARPIQKYGLTRAFRDGFVPFIGRLKKFELSKREAKLAGVALDPILHTRAYQLYDIVDEYTPRTKFERGMEYATARMGALALFDYWTAAMKELSASTALVKLSDSIGLIINGGSKRDLAEATEFLAAAGIGEKEARAIWEQMLQPGGSDLIEGIRIPNTDAWTDPNAVRAFRAALRGEADDTIITPGFERPLWVDNTLPGRMIAQFKSFAMASTTKTLMAGLQQRDMAFLTGTTISLAMGAFSYYLWAVSVGGEAYEEMLKAGPDKWADEAITRSGNLAIFGEVQRMAENVPALRKFATFSNQRTTRRAGTDLTEAVLGPSFDALQKSAAVIAGLDDPTDSTLHSLRLLAPLQNLFFLRQAFDAVENAIGQNLPDKRGE